MFCLCGREALRTCCVSTISLPCHKKTSLDPSDWRDAVGTVLAFPQHHSLPIPPLLCLINSSLTLPCFTLLTPPCRALTFPSSCPRCHKTIQVLASPGAFLSHGCSSKVHHWHEQTCPSPGLGQVWIWLPPQETHGDRQLLTGMKKSLSGNTALQRTTFSAAATRFEVIFPPSI